MLLVAQVALVGIFSNWPAAPRPIAPPVAAPRATAARPPAAAAAPAAAPQRAPPAASARAAAKQPAAAAAAATEPGGAAAHRGAQAHGYAFRLADEKEGQLVRQRGGGGGLLEMHSKQVEPAVCTFISFTTILLCRAPSW